MRRKRESRPTYSLPTPPFSNPNTQASAAKTALLLDHTQLGGTVVRVEAAQKLDDMAPKETAAASEEETKEHEREPEQEIPQEDKPRSRIVAEYLAHGYALSDPAIQKAIALDQKHGFSARFTTALNNFDRRFQASDRARGIDESYKLSDRAATGWRGINSYFEKAMGTPSGRKLRDFYAQTDKQVRDIHSEARRLADIKSGKISHDSEAPAQSQSEKAQPQTIPETGGAEAADVAPSTAPTSEPAGAAPPAEPKT